MKDITLVNHLQSMAGQQAGKTEKTAEGFTETLKNVIDETNKMQVKADNAAQKLNTGESKNLHEVMIAMEKADISMRLLVQMRNKIVDAYKEIMRMSV